MLGLEKNLRNVVISRCRDNEITTLRDNQKQKRVRNIFVFQKFVVPLHRFFDVTDGRKKSCLSMLRETY